MYETFARVYDTFMDEVPYDAWARCLVRELKKDGIGDGLVLDLGCGTGQITERLARAGYDMIGVDLSADMLQIAQERKGDCDILYLMQDIRQFELYGTVRAVISTCDSLNYMTDPGDLLQVFKLVNNYLDPGGLFLFDMNSLGYYEKLCADNTFAESRDDCSFIWENSYDPKTQINEYDLTLFLQRENGMYERFLETHRERGYAVREIRMLLEKAGMKAEGASGAYADVDEDAPDRHILQGMAKESGCDKAMDSNDQNGRMDLDRGTERILFCARECGKRRRMDS